MKNNLHTIILFSILGTACAESLDEPEEIDWYSDRLDTDGDMIYNPHDDCPLEPEDYNTIWDGPHWEELSTDGCPTIDNDGDRVDDKVDACPNDPECWTDSCLVGMSQTLACESHICYRGECIRNDTRYSCNHSIGSDIDQEALWEAGASRRGLYDNHSGWNSPAGSWRRSLIDRGEQLIAACEQRLEENWEENQRTEN